MDEREFNKLFENENENKNKFTPEIIKEKKTRPYINVELFDKKINALKKHQLFEIGDNENDIRCLTENSLFGTSKLTARGYIANQFRDCINSLDDIKKITIMIRDKQLAFYDYTVPSLFDLIDKQINEPQPKQKRKYVRKNKISS